MRHILTDWPAIEKQVRKAQSVALMFDFDGTLSPIVSMPQRSYLPVASRHVLRALNRVWPVAVITGRQLSVIQKKVGVREFIYGASHGLEWYLGGKRWERPIPESVNTALLALRRETKRLKKIYPLLLLEPKRFAVTFHYHLVPRAQLPRLIRKIKELLIPARGNQRLRIFWDKKTIDIVPQLQWTKGDVALYILKYLREKTGHLYLPLYVGDSSTDEDAFRALRGGITIRVNKKSGSAAKYYFADRGEVDMFLTSLLRISKTRRQC